MVLLHYKCTLEIKLNSPREYCEVRSSSVRETHNLHQCSVVITLWLAMAGPSQCACISDMVIVDR
jgi:hypothetical protein